MGTEYNVDFYEDASGHQPVVGYMRQLQRENTKDARIKLTKIRDYVKLLKMNWRISRQDSKRNQSNNEEEIVDGES